MAAAPQPVPHAAQIRAAETLCQLRGARMTEMRKAVYGCLLKQGAPLSAYDLMQKLDRELDRRLAPPTVYRALEFLLAHGLIHRLESANAYMACISPGEAHESIYFLCSECGATTEIADQRIGGLLSQDASSLHFKPRRQVVEVQGLCRECGD